MIIDSHCHLDFPILYNNLDQVIQRAQKNDVKYLLTISTTMDSFKKIILIVNKYDCVYGTVGIHPHETKNFEDFKSDILINEVKKNSKIIGIGETGLDFYYNHSDSKIQKKIFLEHIIACSELKIPLIVHTRNAEKDTLDILKNETKNLNLKILMHCFTGSENFCKKLLDLGCYISLSGIITFKNSTNLSNLVKIIPLNRLLVETDSPYLSPVPFRGKDNEPSYIKYTVDKISSIKNVDVNLIKNGTSKNFLNLFNLNI